MNMPVIQTYGCDRDTDDELWEFYNRIPEAFWFVQFIGRSMRNVILAAALKIPGGKAVPVGRVQEVEEKAEVETAEGQQAGTETAETTMVEAGEVVGEPLPDGRIMVYRSALEHRAAELVNGIDGPDGLPGIMQHSGELLVVVGKGYLVAHVQTLTTDRDGNDLPPGDYDYEIIEWEVFSTDDLQSRDSHVDELGRKVKIWQKMNAEGNWVDLPEGTHVYPLRDRHPRKKHKVKSAFMAARDSLRRICQYQAALQSIADSRLAMRGLLLIAAEWDIKPPKNWDEERDGEFSFATQLHSAIVAPITSKGSSTGAAPLVAEVPYEYLKDGYAFIDFFSTYDEHITSMIDQDLGRVAIAWDAPTPLMTVDGLQDTNHWNLWAIQESADITTWRPLGSIIAGAVTRYLHHQLVSENYEPDAVRQICAIADTSEIMSKANRVEESCSLHEKSLLSREATVLESGFGVDQMPGEKEMNDTFMRSVALRTSNGNLQVLVLKMLGLIPEDADVGDGSSSSDSGFVGDDGETTPDVTDSETAPDEPSDLLAGAGLLAGFLGFDQEDKIDTDVPEVNARLAILAMAESSALDLVKRAGNVIRHQATPAVKDMVKGLEPWQIPHIVGEDLSWQIWSTYEAERDEGVWGSVFCFRLNAIVGERYGDDVASAVISEVLSIAQKRCFADLTSETILADSRDILSLLPVLVAAE